jgi:hypothetical protein
MGCSSTENIENIKVEPAKEPLTDPSRYCAYKLDVKEEDHILIYDFQAREGRILKVAMDPQVYDYTIFINHPLLFVAGGVEKATNNLCNKLWLSSPGEDTVMMSGCKAMNVARRKPFLSSPKEGVVYIIGGSSGANVDYLPNCERFKIGEDSIITLRQMDKGHEHIIAVGKYIYAMDKLIDKEIFEVFDSTNEDNGWEKVTLAISGASAGIKVDSRFGIVPENNSNPRLLIFGGLTKEGKHCSEAVALDAKAGTIVKEKDIPGEESFLLPSTAGKSNAYILTRTFNLYIYIKEKSVWATYPTYISSQLSAKGLHSKG